MDQTGIYFGTDEIQNLKERGRGTQKNEMRYHQQADSSAIRFPTAYRSFFFNFRRSFHLNFRRSLRSSFL
jgi:hypothetical protein